MERKWLIALVALALAAAGCSVQVRSKPQGTTQVQPGLSASAGTPADTVKTEPANPPPVPTAAAETPPAQSPPVQSPPVQSPPVQSPPVQSPPVQSPPAPPAPQEKKPAIRLVPIDPAWGLAWTMPVPEGWPINVTALMDNVQIYGDPVLIMVSTRQLRDQAAPRTIAEMRSFIAAWAPPGTEVKQVQHRGAASAFELRYPVQGSAPPETDLSLYLFGSTYHQIVSLTAPTAAMSQWEPLFREMLAGFVPANLDAEPLPGRP